MDEKDKKGINEEPDQGEMNTPPRKTNNPLNRPDKRDLLKRRRGPASQQGDTKGAKNGWPLGHRIAFILLLVILGLFLWKQMNPENVSYIKITYTQFNQLIKDNNLKKVKIRDSYVLGELKAPSTLLDKTAKPYKNVSVNIGNYDHAFIKELVDKGVEVSIEQEKTWVNMLISILPWILIFGVWIFFLRQMQGGPKGVFTFGKSKAKLLTENKPKITFADVAGVEEAKVELQEIIEFLKEPGKFQLLGGKIPKGALLVGPPGTGKTLLARAVAGEAGVPFYSMSGSDFVEMFVGVGASRVRDLFEQGKSNAPCIIFIDEIDAVGRQRGAGIGGGHDEREQTLNQLLVEMDGFDSNEGVILLAATNRPDVLDPALLRPGRFDRQIVVDWPDVKAREEILKVHVKNIRVAPEVDMKSIAKGTPGMTGADLANVVNEAALLAARLSRKKVVMADFEEAKDKVMMGSARRSLVITDDEKRLTAYHEAGHALVSKFIPGADPVHKVSIVARGRALGLTHFLPLDERHNWSYNYCLGKMAILLGGRAAEFIKFGDVTNGASNDIETTTSLARKMVCEWGMSKRLGPMSFGKKEHEIFLGREINTHKDFSEETAVAIDQEIKKLVEYSLQRAESIIRDNMDKIEALTGELLRKEILAGDEIDQILNGVTSAQKNRSRNRNKKKSSPRPPRDRDSENIQNKPAIEKSDTEVTSEVLPSEAPEKEITTHVRRNFHRRNQSTHDNENLNINPPHEKVKQNSESENNDSAEKTTGSDKADIENDKFGARRNKMVRLKIGGRRKTIQKAPAQKIRKVN